MAKNKNLKVFGIIFLLVIVIVSILFFSGILQTGVPDCNGGLQITSIDNVNVANSDNLGGKQVIRATVVVNNKGECGRIIFDKNDINEDLKVDGYAISKSVFLDVSSIKQEKSWNIRDLKRPINRINYFELSKLEGLNPRLSVCKNKQLTSFTRNFFTCFYTESIGNVGEIETTGKLTSTIGFKLSSGENAEVNSDDGIINLDNKAVIKWSGNLLSNIDIQTPKGDGLLSNQWIIAESGYENRINNNFIETKTCIESKTLTNSIINQCINPFNNLVASESKSIIINNELLSVNPIISDAKATISGNILKLEFNEPIVFSQFIIDLDAAFLGIYQISGIPKATCPDDQDYDSGATKMVKFEIENIGKSSGRFNLKLVCSGQGRIISPNNVLVSPNNVVTVKGISTGSNPIPDTISTQECIFTATDSTSGKQDTCKYSDRIRGRTVPPTTIPGVTTTTIPLECKEGEQRKPLKITETCDVHSGLFKYSCIAIGKPSRGTITEEGVCYKPLITPTLIYVIIGAIFLIILTLILTRNRGTRKRK